MIDILLQFSINKPKVAALILFVTISLLVGLVWNFFSLFEKKVIRLTIKSLGWKNAKIYKIGSNIDGHYTGHDGPNFQVDYQDEKDLWHTKYCRVFLYGLVWFDDYY